MLDPLPADFDPSTFNAAELVKSEHNQKMYQATQALKQAINDLVDYELAHPKILTPTTPEEARNERKAERELSKREGIVKSQLAWVKVLYRQSILKIREEKANTAVDKAVNDQLLLGLSNLRYEEQSLKAEIAGAEKFDHKYTKLNLISREEFLALFPEHASSSEHALMIARIEHEHQDRVRNEERRQEKLKEKQKLISEVKKSKENLTNLDSMVDRIEEAMAPIRKVLANDE
ncbi:hypothetical protein P280DRAFT_390225 [Massarina eburnea CBS 473.64]|uniref:Fms interacting protein n=1 Tax=Massarina eburnea CBS 473.64 TaxID=1395130 RepID=A0A6A6SGE0_9PLEO|nr:hypothetical protein P280DRAFT_390225 [Massarina eburnea CBS 473.64]